MRSAGGPRQWALFVGALVLALVVGVLGGCGSDAGDAISGGATTTPASAQPADAGLVPAEVETMEADGPGESAALGMLPGLVDEAATLLAGADAVPEVENASAALVAYLVSVELDGQVTLCEVRADGIAHSLYAYYRPFDSGSLLWEADDPLVASAAAPRSAGERSAVEAVESEMAEDFPDVALTTRVYGYRYAYVSDGAVVLVLEVTPDGRLISANTSIR